MEQSVWPGPSLLLQIVPLFGGGGEENPPTLGSTQPGALTSVFTVTLYLKTSQGFEVQRNNLHKS
jgi:hypothetical protein